MPGVYDEVVNANEELIKQKLEELWKNNKFCKCDRCKRDVYALVLNRTAPHYVVSHKGKLFTKLNFSENKENIEVVKTIMEVMDTIGKHPNHN